MTFTFPPVQKELSSCFPCMESVGGWVGGRGLQENRRPEPLLLHLPLLRFVPEDPRGRCPGPSGRGAAQVRKLGVPDVTRMGNLPTQGWDVPGKKVGKAGTEEGEEGEEGRSGRVRVGPKVQTSAKLLSTPGEAGLQHPGLWRIPRCFMATQASSSRLLKRSRSCWPHRRLYR